MRTFGIGDAQEFYKLIDLAEQNSHWLLVDLDNIRGNYKVGKKTFKSIPKAIEEIERLVKERKAALKLLSN